MKTLYLDIFSGISGDMFLGALIDLGVELPRLEQELSKLGLTGYHLHAVRRQNSQIDGIKFDVHLEADHEHSHDHHHEGHEHDHGHEHHHDHDHDHEHPHAQDPHHHAPHDHAHEESRDFAAIKKLISQSALSHWVKEKSIAVFQRVAAAEGKIHGQPPDRVHFHEVGAVDSIVDIVGACLGLELLGQPRVLSAPVVEGHGWVNCAHGRFAVPTPATLEILGARGAAITQCDEPHELVTPTGAALLAEFAEGFGPMRGLIAEKIGYGLGSRQNKTRPNVLRAILGTASPAEAAAASSASTNPSARDWEEDSVVLLETNIDDCNAEILGYFMERALAAGALDVFHTPIQMKKNRPGVLLSVLCTSSAADEFSEMMLRETSAFGIRRSTLERRKLRRESATVTTPFGQVAIKLGKLNGRIVRATPEFEACKKAALAAHVPLKLVYEAAEQAAQPLRTSA